MINTSLENSMSYTVLAEPCPLGGKLNVSEHSLYNSNVLCAISKISMHCLLIVYHLTISYSVLPEAKISTLAVCPDLMAGLIMITIFMQIHKLEPTNFNINASTFSLSPMLWLNI